MDISKLKNYLGHDCLFEVETTSSTPAISFKYNENPASTISLVELCIIDPNPNGKCYHTILERDKSSSNPITSHTIINDGTISLQYNNSDSTLCILPKNSSTIGKWQIYMRIFGSASLNLPPVACHIPSSGYSNVDDIV